MTAPFTHTATTGTEATVTAPTRTDPADNNTGSNAPAVESALPGYYGLPIVEEHGWKDYIGVYFFTGGVAGAASVLAAAAELSGRPRLARQARVAAMIGLLPSPPLLIADLTRPARFLNMLRVCKPSSPMSVGSWLLVGYSGLIGTATGLDWWRRWPTLRRMATVGAGATGSVLATYTAVLVSDTATPVWHEARRQLPFVFAAGAAAGGGAVTTVVSALVGSPSPEAMRMAGRGALAQLGATHWMTRRLGSLDSYHHDRAARRWLRAATVGATVGMLALFVSAGRRRGRHANRPLAILGSIGIAMGSLCERLAVLRAGTASAQDPNQVLLSQRHAADRIASQLPQLMPLAGDNLPSR